MAITIKFDSANNPLPSRLILATKSGNRIRELPISNVKFRDSFLNGSEFSFNVFKNHCVNKSGEVDESFWRRIVDFKIAYCPEFDMWYEIHLDLEESDETIKSCTAVSLAEAELSQINVYGIEVNTEADIARADYKPTVLFDPEDKDRSLVDRLLYKAPHYSVKHVDYTIANIQRSFSFNDTSILDAYQEIATEYNCLFIVEARKGENSKIERTISVYDLENYCLDCHNRGEFSGACDKCGSTNIKYGYGDDTSIFVSRKNLAQEINYSTDVDSVKNCFRLEGGDDLMTATIINCNPNGSQYLWYITDAMKSDMSDALRERLDAYDDLYAAYQNTESYSPPANLRTQYNEIVNRYKSVKSDLEEIPENIIGFPALMTAYYNTIDLQMFLNNSMMPNIETETTDAAQEAAKLTVTNLSPVAVANLAACTESTAASAVLSVAKCFVRGSFQVKVNESSYNANTYRWTGNFTVTNYSDEEDVATSPTITVSVTSELETFVKQKIQKAMAQQSDDPTSVSELFALELAPFKAELKKYSLQRLIAFRDVCQVSLDIMIQQGLADRQSWVSTQNNLYDNMYLPYYNKMSAIEEEIYIRTAELSVVVGVYDENDGLLTEGMQSVILAKRNEIQSILNFEEYLGSELWLEFASFRREDTFTNKNYISDGLNNEEIFTRAEEFINLAQKEIYRSAVLQHSISSTLSNLLTMQEFQPIVDKFKVGNWLRIEVDGEIYRLRMIEYTIDYDSWKLSSVEFSDVRKGYSSASDIQSLLSSLRSMSSSYGSVSRQAQAGKKSQEEMENWVTDGFKLTSQKIVGGAANQEFEIGETGITGREYIPETEGYKDEQVKIISSGLYVTDDGWLTAKAGVGRFVYYNPVTKQMEEAYGVIADKLVGNLVLSQEVGIYNENSSITLDYDGFTLITEAGANAKTFRILRKEEDETLTNILSIDSNGNLLLNGYSTTGEMNSAISASAQSLTTQFNQTLQGYDTKQEVNSKIEQSANTIMTNVSNTYMKSNDARAEFIAKSNGITDVETQYAVGNNDQVAPSSGWSTDSPTWEEGKYIWQRTKTTNGNDVASYSEAVCIQGAAGKGIYSITEYYAVNNDYDNAPADSAFSTDIPQMSATEPYLWNYEITVFTDQTQKKTTKHVIGTYSITGSEIISVRQLYAAGTSDTVAPDDNVFGTELPTLTSTNKYLWATELVIYSDSTSSSTDKYVLATYSGKAVTAVRNYYLASQLASGVTRETLGWTTDMQAATPLQKYLWNYKEIVWASGNPTYTTPVIIGQFNITGADGKGIEDIKNYYLASPLQSGITKDSPGWTEQVQTVSTTNKYLWNYEVISYTEGNPTTTTPVIIGVYGDTGLTGRGITSVVEYYAKSASNAEAPADSEFTTTIQTVDATQRYLWAYELITYTDTTTEKTSKRVIGQFSQDGANGLNSVIINLYKRSLNDPTIDWQDTLTYSFTAKSLTTVPSGWSQTVPEGDYPLYVTMATAASEEATATIAYTEWTPPRKIASSGEDGINTATVYLYKRANSASVNWENDLTYTFATGALSSVPTGWSQTIPDGTLPIMVTFATASARTGTDTIPPSEWATPRVLARNGVDGVDAYTVILSNENHTFAGNTSEVIPASIDCKIIAYKGITQVAPTIGTITGVPNGMTATIVGNSTTNAKVTIAVTAALTQFSGTLDIPITVDGKSFTKSFTYNVSLNGESATTYHINVSHSAIQKSESGTYSPTSITVSAKSQTGEETMADYVGRFRIETTADNATWTVRKDSSSDESSTTYQIPIGIAAIRCSLYEAGGFTTLLDQQTVPIVSDGISGISITNVVDRYLATPLSTGVTTETAGWTTTIQTVTTTNKYLWNYEEIQYSRGQPTHTDPVIIGVYGDTGGAGADGRGVSALVQQYYLSTSDTTQTGGQWSTAQPEWQEDHYIWERTEITWLNSDQTTSVTYTTPVLAQALNGANALASQVQADLIENYSTTTQTDTMIQNTVKSYQKILDTKADNLITYPYAKSGTYIESGLTITVNEDGSIIVTGTSTDDVFLYLTSYTDGETLPAGTYTLSMGDTEVEGAELCWRRKPIGSADEYSVASANPQTAAVIYNYPDDPIAIFLYLHSGKTFSFTAYPQLEYGSVGHNWQPTARSYSSQITQTATEIEARVESVEEVVASLGSDNLIPCPYNVIYNSSGDVSSSWLPGHYYEYSGVRFTIEKDGSITVNGTATADINKDLIRYSQKYTLPNGTYTLCGNATASGIRIGLYRFPDKEGQTTMYPISGVSEYDASLEGGASFEWSTRVYDSDSQKNYDQFFCVRLKISSGATFSNVVLKPMLEPGDTAHEWTSPVYSTTSKIVSSESSIRVNANSIAAKVSVGNVAAQLTLECTDGTSTVDLGADRVTINSTAFKLDRAGNVDSSGKFRSRNIIYAADYPGVIASDMPSMSVVDEGGVDIFVGSGGTTDASTRICQFGPAFDSQNISSPTELGCGLNADNGKFVNLQAGNNHIMCYASGGVPNDVYGKTNFGQDGIRFWNSSNHEIYWYNQSGLMVDNAIYTWGLNVLNSGAKKKVIETEDYGVASLYCLESTRPMFSDIGSGIIDDNGICYIMIDPVFSETIDLNCDYQVFTTQTSEGSISWLEKHTDYFIVHGTVGTTFDWMMYAHQIWCTQDDIYDPEMQDIPKAQERILKKETNEKPYDGNADQVTSNMMMSMETDYDQLAEQYMEQYESEIEDI